MLDKDSTIFREEGDSATSYGQHYYLLMDEGAVTTAITSTTSGTITETQPRFECHAAIDTDETVLENTKDLIANMRGIFTYTNGTYSLDVEGTESSVVSLDEDDILESGLELALENKEQKYNKVEVEFYNSSKKYEADTVVVTDGLSDDGNEVLEHRAQFPFVTNQRVAYNHAEAILNRSRNNRSVSFVATPKVLKARVGEVITITSSDLNLSAEPYRITQMNIMPDLNIQVSAVEYQASIYGWQDPPAEDIGSNPTPPDPFRVVKPTSLAYTAKNTTTGEPAKLTWSDSTEYPSFEFRVQILSDSSSKTRFDKRVKATEIYLDGINIDTGFVAKVSAINSLGTESDPVELTFAVTTAPITTVDIGQGSIGGFSFDATKMYHGTGTFNNSNTAVYFDNAGQFSLKDKLSWNGTTLNISGNLTVENTITADKIILNGQALSSLMSSTGAGATTIDELTVSNDCFLEGGFSISASHDGLFADNSKAIFGAGSDLQIYHDGNDSYVDDAGTGILFLRGNSAVKIRKYTGEAMIDANVDGSVVLYNNNSAKLATTSTGIDVTGGQRITGDSGSSGFMYIFDSDNGTSNTDGFLLQKSGNNAFVYNRESSGSLSLGAGNTSNYLVIDSSGNIDLGSTQILDQSRNLTNIGTISSGAITSSGRIKANFGLFQSFVGNLTHREYVVETGGGGGDFFLGQIEFNDASDGAVTGCVYFAYDYGTTTESPKIHFSFAQRNGTARGNWWYEHDDDAAGSNNVKVVLVDDGSGGMFVWLRVGDFARIKVTTEWHTGGNITASGQLSSGTITTGTTLFDTSNDPTSEHHIGKLFAHGDSEIEGQLTIGSGNNLVNAGNMTVDVAGDLTLDADGGDIMFKDGGTERARFTSTGLGIGTTSPSASYKLDVNGKIRSQQEILINTGSLFVNQEGEGIHLMAPNGTEYKITVSNAGALVITEQ